MRAPAVKRRVPWVVGGVTAIVLVAAALAWFLIPRGSPEDQAMAYLQALADGDATSVRAIGLDIPQATASAFADASDRVSAGTVVSSKTDGRTAVVDVSFELAGTRHESVLTLSQHDGRWVPDAASALGSVRLAVPVAIAGTALHGDTALLLPAVYDMNAAPADFLDGSATIEVLPGSTDKVDIDATLRPEATDAAQAQLDDHLAACTEPAAEVASSCGIAIPWAADFSAVSEIRYRIEESPVISLTPSAFQADGGVLVATVKGTALDGSAESLTYRSENWSVRGDVTFAGDDIVLSVW